jgi:hypothetical protein
MDTFAQAVEGWHDFYLMIGAAAATLVGLLFVSLSLNVDAITREANADLRMLAAQTFTRFLNVVMLAVSATWPVRRGNSWADKVIYHAPVSLLDKEIYEKRGAVKLC